MNPIYPPLTICIAPLNVWNFTINGLSLRIFQEEIDASLRRLMKGTDRSLERNRLILWFDQLMSFMPGIPRDSGVNWKALPFANTPDWVKLLGVLAQSLSIEAMHPGGVDRIPPFLSGIWGPPLENGKGSAPYRSTVKEHLELLNRLEHQNELAPQVLKMLLVRKNLFQFAVKQSSGIIECVGDLFTKDIR
jgi:hypothetical protein